MVKQKKTKDVSLLAVKLPDQKCQPTPDQIRIAQILDKKAYDSTIKQKLKQIMDATQRSADEAYVALHDSDFDMNRAVDLLIEGNSLADWCTSEKRKKKMQELKEKKTEETEIAPETNGEASRGHPRNGIYKGRGGDQGARRGRGNMPDRRHYSSNDDSAAYVRGRGFQGRGRRGQRGQRSAPGGTMVFERSNIPEHPTSATGFQPAPVELINRWEKPLNHNVEEDWDTEEFTGSLSKTQIFTSSVKQDLKPENDCDTGAQSAQSDSSRILNVKQLTIPAVAPMPPTSVVLSQPQLPYIPLVTGHAPVPSVTFNKKETIPQPDLRSNLDAMSDTPSEPSSEYLYRLSNYNPKPDLHIPVREERKPIPSKIPTTAVEMPPEMKSSLSFLDIQFGAIDIGQSGSDAGSSESHSNILSENVSTTTLIPPSSIPSSASTTQLIASNSNSSTSSNIITQSNATCANKIAVKHLVQPNGGVVSSGVGVNHHVTSGNTSNSGSVNRLVNSTVPSSVNHVMGSGSNHHLGTNSPTLGQGGQQTPGRYVPSSQPYSSNHFPYSFITPSNGTPAHQYESRGHETNTSVPPPHVSQPPHHPSFKQPPPGVPKGAIVANLPPGSLVGNQYIVGQSNVPYFPHHPIYYYEEVPPMNNQQRISNHISTGYEVNYQTNNPSNRVGVHYNV